MGIERDNFESISSDKNDIMALILSDEPLVKCLASPSPNFLDETVEDKVSLLYQSIFPFRYIPDTQEKNRSYITMKFKYNRVRSGNYWKRGTIYFYMFCHKDIVRTNYGKLRYDFMLQRINHLMNGSRSLSCQWLGEAVFEDLDEVIIDDSGNYVGVVATYQVVEKI